MINLNSKRYLLLACLAGGIAGCMHYQPRPLNLTESAASFSSVTLSDPKIQERLDALGMSDSIQTGQWNRAQLLVVASERNPKISIAKSQLKVAAAAKKTAIALPNPTLGLGAEYNLSQTSESPWLWSVSTDWLLDLGLHRDLRIQAADTELQAVRLDYAEALWTVRGELRSALLSYLISTKKVDVLTQLESHQVQLLDIQLQRISHGESSQNDAFQVELELARTRSNLADSIRTRSQSQAQIAEVLGVPVSAVQSQSLIWDDLMQMTPIDEASLTILRDRALLSRTDLERAVNDYQRSELSLKQAINDQYPQFSIGPGYSWDHGVKKISFGLSFGLPVFNRNQGPIEEALALREQAGQRAFLVQTKITNEIDSALQSYQLSIKSIQAVMHQHEIAGNLAVQVQQSMMLGAADRSDEIAAQVNVDIQSLAVLDSVERMQQSFGQLEDALRMPLSGPEVLLKRQVLLQSKSEQ